MSLMKIMQTRRSIRRFTNQQVPTAALAEILEAARWAPSWANTQSWEIIVVRDEGQRKKLAEIVPSRNPASPACQQAPAILVICGALKKAGYYQGEPLTAFGDWLLHDLGLMTQNIILTAHALGLGTVVVGVFAHDRVREIIRLPEEYAAVTLLPLGFPAHSPSAPPRRLAADYTHLDFFGRKEEAFGDPAEPEG